MKKRSIIILIVSSALVLVALVGAAFIWTVGGFSNSTAPATSTKSTQDTRSLATVSERLDSPWSVVFYKDVPLVSSRDTGEIRELDKDGNSRVIGVVDGAVHQSEGGLLGLTVDAQSRLYAYYTTATDNRIVRLTINGEAGDLSIGQAEVIVDSIPKSSNHNGGRIAFGPDGQLYATVGDAGNKDAAQDLARLHGKILRITPDGDVPTDNPFPNSLVYSYGHRNPQGITWGDDGTMYSTEFGQNTWDELNIITAGANYGWPLVEGIENREGFVAPVQQWATRDASPSGIAYADGMIYIANLRGTVLRAVPVSDLATYQDFYKGEYGRIRDVVIAPDGQLWFVTNNTDGRGVPSANDDRIISVPLTDLK